jgi:hypothetical protein
MHITTEVEGTPLALCLMVMRASEGTGTLMALENGISEYKLDAISLISVHSASGSIRPGSH